MVVQTQVRQTGFAGPQWILLPDLPSVGMKGGLDPMSFPLPPLPLCRQAHAQYVHACTETHIITLQSGLGQ